MCAGRLRLVIDKAVVAYRKPLDRPFFTVSLRDAAGRLLEPPVDTPPGHYARAERCIAAAHAVTLRTPLQDLPGGGRPLGTGLHVCSRYFEVRRADWHACLLA